MNKTATVNLPGCIPELSDSHWFLDPVLALIGCEGRGQVGLRRPKQGISRSSLEIDKLSVFKIIGAEAEQSTGTRGMLIDV